MRLLCVFLLFTCVFADRLRPAAQEAPGSVDAASFFSGVVTQVSAESITVSRTILGKAAETRTFAITPETKIEGQLKAKSRVTVRFAQSDSGDVAISIVVRDGRKGGGKK